MSKTYDNSYFLGLSAPTDNQVIGPLPVSSMHVLTDDADAGDDGMVAVSDTVTWDTGQVTQPISTVYLGMTAAGDPIIEANFGGVDRFYYVLSDNPSLQGTSIGTITSGNLIVCFAEGTHIRTPDGERCVEDLRPGDLVVTADGREALVRWVGEKRVSTQFGPADRLLPILIKAGALGRNMPTRDLTVTADHALFLDGVLVCAGVLVNGVTITRVPVSELGDSYTVYHVETERHEVILAEGTPAESYIDYVARTAFDNHGALAGCYGADALVEELPYPRITSAQHLRGALRDRVCGWPSAASA